MHGRLAHRSSGWRRSGQFSRTPRADRPWYFDVRSDEEYADCVEAALSTAHKGFDPLPAREQISVDYTVDALAGHLIVAATAGRPLGAQPLLARALDIRLGRHHGIGHNRNSVPQTTKDFVRYLSDRRDGDVAGDAAAPDPELAIAALHGWRSSPEDVAAGASIGVGPGAVGRFAQRVTGKARLVLGQSRAGR